MWTRRWLYFTAAIVMAALLLLPANAAAGPDVAPESQRMIDARTGWAWSLAPGQFRLLRTDNGGGRWIEATPPQLKRSGAFAGFAGFFLNGEHGWVSRTGKEGMLVLRTSNGGQTWIKTTLPGPFLAKQIYFINPHQGWLVANRIGSAMKQTQKNIYRTEDAGTTWTLVSGGSGLNPSSAVTMNALPELGAVTGLVFRNAKDGWVTLENSEHGAPLLYRSKDGGSTWSPVRLEVPKRFQSGSFRAISQAPVFSGKNKLDGVLTVNYAEPDHTGDAVYLTNDGGETWRLR